MALAAGRLRHPINHYATPPLPHTTITPQRHYATAPSSLSSYPPLQFSLSPRVPITPNISGGHQPKKGWPIPQKVEKGGKGWKKVEKGGKATHARWKQRCPAAHLKQVPRRHHSWAPHQAPRITGRPGPRAHASRAAKRPGSRARRAAHPPTCRLATVFPPFFHLRWEYGSFPPFFHLL